MGPIEEVRFPPDLSTEVDETVSATCSLRRIRNDEPDDAAEFGEVLPQRVLRGAFSNSTNPV